MEVLTWKVPPEEDGVTVRHILRRDLRFSARAVSRLKWTPTGILVDGERAHTDRILHTGEVVRAETGDHRGPKKAVVPGDWPLPVVWEDGHLLVVDKPAGMTAHASNFDPAAPTVAGALAWTRGTGDLFHPVDRLDRGTTGLMVIAKSGYVHELLRRALHTGAFRREYRAVCVGRPVPERGVVDAPIGRDERSLVARRVRPDGKPSVTRYEVLAGDGERSLLRAVPETGRTHQIRVHLAHLGHPLVGDWLYGREDPSLIGRPALHSYELAMDHPVTGDPLRWTAPLPEDMARLVRGLPDRGDIREEGQGCGPGT